MAAAAVTLVQASAHNGQHAQCSTHAMQGADLYRVVKHVQPIQLRHHQDDAAPITGCCCCAGPAALPRCCCSLWRQRRQRCPHAEAAERLAAACGEAVTAVGRCCRRHCQLQPHMVMLVARSLRACAQAHVSACVANSTSKQRRTSDVQSHRPMHLLGVEGGARARISSELRPKQQRRRRQPAGC